MKIIDWYILKKFFQTFLFFLLALTVLVIIVDLSERTDDFAKTGLPAKTIIEQYYFGFIPRIDAMLFPLFVFLSVIFFRRRTIATAIIIGWNTVSMIPYGPYWVIQLLASIGMITPLWKPGSNQFRAGMFPVMIFR